MNKFASSQLTQYLYIWYDYDAQKSYDNTENKNAKLRNMMLRIKKTINKIMEVSGITECEIGDKPHTVEDYENWKQQTKDKSFIAVEKMYKEFERCGVLGKNINSMNKLTVNSIDAMYKRYKIEKMKLTDV